MCGSIRLMPSAPIKEACSCYRRSLIINLWCTLACAIGLNKEKPTYRNGSILTATTTKHGRINSGILIPYVHNVEIENDVMVAMKVQNFVRAFASCYNYTVLDDLAF